MSRVVAIICILLVVVAVPLWALMAGFSPALLTGQTASASALSKLLGNSIVAVIWLTPLWVLYFGWQMIKSWRTAPGGPALMMALPAIGIIALLVWINFGSFAP